MKKQSFHNNLTAYLRQKRGIILTLLLFFAIFSCLFYLYRIPQDALLYGGILCLIIGIILLIIDFSRFCENHRNRTVPVPGDLPQTVPHPHHRIGTGQRHPGDDRF